MTTNDLEWDGRAEFYPSVGYTIDKDHVEMYERAVEREGMPYRQNQDSFDEENEGQSQDSDEEYNGEERSFNSPPLYNRQEVYHPFKEKDDHFKLLLNTDQQFEAAKLVETITKKISKEDPTSRHSIPKETFRLIHQNRNMDENVIEGLKSTFVLDIAIVGLKEEISPYRQVQVPGRYTLSEFHDLVYELGDRTHPPM